ncbi:hypothetical protein [Paraliomyxa miuraensis]|uniref:hypothetical protein n=1 Tax=Paraliomyxa miuraensis TaxID=376150 RepID=UPI00225285E9|nr:hypothetical protein [Paraliomyxa miuraensis]MCX4240851.1 hypothetical protein [Paraliomyxa miuraensis]
MIFVSGTKRSGTSMWMQVFQAAGLPILGKAFPRNWGTGHLRDANPDGFYETLLRGGVYYRTNPHPQTGKYFLPEHVVGYAVKVFVPGVIRSERAYIEYLVANIREWREYEASIERLYAMEAKSREEQRAKGVEVEEPFNFPPAYEWWMENFALVRDISLRKYPALLQTYDQVLEDPERTIGKVLRTIGHGDVEAGVAAVKPENRTQTRPESSSMEAKLAQVFDDLYAAIYEGKGIGNALLKTLNDTNIALLPELTKLQTEVARSQMKRQAKSGGKGRPIEITGLPEV